jgi:cytochrome d ubiquinol oxidase subunit II
MEAIWFSLIAVMLTTYVVLDGFDLGAGLLHLRVAQQDDERRTILAAIGPVWDGNEVWLIASGGVLVFAFPRVYAVAFSGFYLPLMLVLWLLVLRGLAIELRGQEANPLWRSFWDTTFCGSSTSIAVVLGCSLGNLLRGVPLDGDGWFHVPLFTDFRVSTTPGALDWYTLSVGALAALVLGAHGAAYLAWKTDGEVGERAFAAARRLWPAVLFATAGVTALTAVVHGGLFRALWHRPWAWPLPLAAAAGLVTVFSALRRRQERRLFLGSAAFVAGVLLATAAGLFPTLLRCTVDEARSLTAYNAANTRHGLLLGLVWWTPAMLLAIGYFCYLFRSFAGKVRPGGDH